MVHYCAIESEHDILVYSIINNNLLRGEQNIFLVSEN